MDREVDLFLSLTQETTVTGKPFASGESVALYAPAVAEPAAQVSTTVLQSCSTVAEETLQGELNKISQQVYGEALEEVDLEAIVARQWTTLEMQRL